MNLSKVRLSGCQAVRLHAVHGLHGLHALHGQATRLLQFGKGRWRDQDGMVNGCIHFQDDLCFVGCPKWGGDNDDIEIRHVFALIL